LEHTLGKKEDLVRAEPERMGVRTDIDDIRIKLVGSHNSKGGEYG
jgi:hypothetical protein